VQGLGFVHFSTNKVYGDAPNRIKLIEKEKRWDYADPDFQNGIAENFFYRSIQALSFWSF